jgi:hypothetical protein
MKFQLLFALLICSLGANAVLLLRVRAEAQSGSEGRETAQPVVSAPEATPQLAWQTLDDNDLTAFTAKLRAAGLPAHLLRTLVRARVDELYAAREAAIKAIKKPHPYWEQSSFSNETQRFYREHYKLEKEKQNLIRSLLGPSKEELAAIQTKYAFVAAEKRQALADFLRSSDDKMADLESSCSPFPTEAESAQLKQLKEERERSLKAMLSPAEYVELEKGDKNSTYGTRSRLRYFDCSENEFNLIADYEKQAYHPYTTAEEWKKLNAEREQRQIQLEANLGKERYAEYVKVSSNEYQNLRDLAQRAELPSDSVDKALDLRTQVTNASWDIVQNKDLSEEQKIEQLKALAQLGRQQLSSLLGPEACTAYLSGTSWIAQIEQGNGVKVSGDSWSMRSVRTSTPPK